MGIYVCRFKLGLSTNGSKSVKQSMHDSLKTALFHDQHAFI